MGRPDEDVVEPAVHRGVVRRIVARRCHHAGEAGDLATGVRDQNPTVAPGALALEIRDVVVEDRLAFGPRRLEPAMKVLVLDDAGAQRIRVARGVVGTDG
jgi:hypothetical protein